MKKKYWVIYQSGFGKTVVWDDNYIPTLDEVNEASSREFGEDPTRVLATRDRDKDINLLVLLKKSVKLSPN